MSLYCDRINQQFKYYNFLSILYAVLAITAQALAYRMIRLGVLLEPGGIFIFPAIFTINDIIAEVYGPTLAMRTIFYGLIAQAFFSLYAMLITHFPAPLAWHNASAFLVVFGASWLVFISNLFAFIIGMILNTKIIAKTKILVRGKFFSIRSIFSSAVGEFFSTAIIVTMALMPIESFRLGLDLFYNMFLFKIFFSFIIVFPASFIVVLLKKLDNSDVYENADSGLLRYTLERKDGKIINLNSFLNKKGPHP